ncbi:unnamed protein product, partial [Adineta steineri]
MDYDSIIFREFTHESIERIKHYREEEAERLACQQLEEQSIHKDNNVQHHPRNKLSKDEQIEQKRILNKDLVVGQELRRILKHKFPQELIGKPIEEIDNDYRTENSNTIISILFVFIYFQSKIVRIQSVTSKGKFDFGPNQLASNIWYKPKGQLINGHYENSYSNFSLWSNLLLNLQNNNGSISIQASEIGYMKNEALMNFRKNNISVIVVLPAFTQCYDGTILGLLELYGESPKENLFCKIFNICNSTDRQDPNGKG